MSSKNFTKFDFFSVWTRIRQETPIKKLSQLAEIISITPQGISLRKKQDIFPVEWGFIVARKYGLLTEWIMTGEGPKRLADIRHGERKEEEAIFRGDLREWLAERIQEDPDFMIGFTARCAVYFPDFAEWLQKKETRMVQGDNKRHQTI